MWLPTEDFELYWLLSASVRSVIKCKGFHRLTIPFCRPCSLMFNAMAVNVAVNLPRLVIGPAAARTRRHWLAVGAPGAPN
jgi:hypothetical protein